MYPSVCAHVHARSHTAGSLNLSVCSSCAALQVACCCVCQARRRRSRRLHNFVPLYNFDAAFEGEDDIEEELEEEDNAFFEDSDTVELLDVSSAHCTTAWLLFSACLCSLQVTGRAAYEPVLEFEPEEDLH